MVRSSRSVRILLGMILFLTVLVGAIPALPASAAGQRWCPQQSAPICSENAFLDYWQAVDTTTGGYALDIIGFPVSPTLQMPNGQIVQFYERAIFEWHPEKSVEYQVLLTRLGAFAVDTDTKLALKAQAAKAPDPCPSTNECYLAKETNHSLRGMFLQYWVGNGGLPVFGFPLTEQFQLSYTGGKTFTVQYFERNRFEAHPENTNPRYQVLLGRLGAEALANNLNEVKAWKTVTTPNYGKTVPPPASPPPATPLPSQQPAPPPAAQGSATVSPASGPVGTTFTTTFSNLAANSTVTVGLLTDTNPPQALEVKDFSVGANGKLQITLDSSKMAAGKYVMAAIKGEAVLAIGRFTITAAAPASNADKQLVNTAFNLISGVPEMKYITDHLIAGNVSWVFDSSLPANTYGRYVPARNTIYYHPMFRTMDLHDLAALTGHEGQHAYDIGTKGVPRTSNDCYVLEYRGFLAESALWYTWYGARGKANPVTEFERDANAIMVDILYNDGKQVIAFILEAYANECGDHLAINAGTPPDFGGFPVSGGIPATLEGLPMFVSEVFPDAAAQLAKIAEGPSLTATEQTVPAPNWTKR